MSAYVYQEFPKVKYHPKLGTKTVQSAKEEKALGKGWYNNPGEFPKPSRIVAIWNHLRAEPWSRNDKIAAFAVAVTILLAVVGLLTPEIRRAIGLDKPTPASTNTPQGQSPKSELSVPAKSNPATAEPPIQKKHQKQAPSKPASQDNSVHIGKGASIEQESHGPCSPNIIGGSNTVNCETTTPCSWQSLTDKDYIRAASAVASTKATIYIAEEPSNEDAAKFAGYIARALEHYAHWDTSDFDTAYGGFWANNHGITLIVRDL